MLGRRGKWNFKDLVRERGSKIAKHKPNLEKCQIVAIG